MKVLAIMGASGHGKVVADTAMASGLWDDIAFYDDAWPLKDTLGQFQIVGDFKSLICLDPKPEVIVAIGDNSVRASKLAELTSAQFPIATVIHPNAIISDSVVIGRGTVIMPGAIVNADSQIGAGCIVNSNAVVEHDCILEDCVHLSPGALLAGGVKVGTITWIGIGASVIQKVIIGKNVIVGAGAAVISDLPDNTTAVGVPAKLMK